MYRLRRGVLGLRGFGFCYVLRKFKVWFKGCWGFLGYMMLSLGVCRVGLFGCVGWRWDFWFFLGVWVGGVWVFGFLVVWKSWFGKDLGLDL